MGLGMRMEMRPQMKLEQAEFLKQELSSRLIQSLELIQLEIVGDPVEAVANLIESVISEMPDGDLKEGLSFFMQSPIFQEMLINNSTLIVSGGARYAHSFSAEFVHKSMGGKFAIANETDENDQHAIVDNIEVSQGDFIEACMNPKRIIDELIALKGVVAASKENLAIDNSGTIRRIGEMQDALDMAEMCKSQVTMIEEVLMFMLVKKDAGGRSLREYLKDHAILKNISYFISERLQKRFISRCMKLTGSNNANQFENAFLNSIGEYVLTSMGVVDPDLFSLQKCELDLDDYLELKKKMNSLGVDLDRKMEDSNFKQSGTIFFNRWKVVGQKLDIVTDEKVREFITSTVRASKDEILRVTKYEELFENIRAIVKEKNKISKEDAEGEFRKLLLDILTEEEFQKKIVSLALTRWDKSLNIFMKDSK